MSNARLLFKHILPNALSPIIVQASLSLAVAVLAEAALSFLGLGTPPDVPSWGNMLREAQGFLSLSPYPALVPGLAIMMTVLGWSMLGDGLRDSLAEKHSFRQKKKEEDVNWYLEALKKYAIFSGRARRKEYWYFTLLNIIIAIVLAVIDGMMGSFDQDLGMGFLGGIYTLAVFLPGIAVSVRRLHDTGRSGWWLLISLIPVVGGIILLIFMAQDSKPGENQYGSNPKELTA